MNRNFFFTITLFLFFLVFASPQSVSAESLLRIDPPQYEARVGEVFEVEVFMSAPNQAINAVAAHIDYNTDILELISYRRTSEEVSFWIESENNPNDGIVVLEGLLVNKGWKGSTEKLARLTFRVKKIGNTEIGITQAALHAYDGTGENIIDRVIQGDITIVPGSAREDFKYAARGTSEVNENYSANILYDDYVRQYHLVRVLPWWAWILFALCLLMFIASYRMWRTMKRYMKKNH